MSVLLPSAARRSGHAGLARKADTERTRLARRFRAAANGAHLIFTFGLTGVSGTPRVLLARGRRDAGRRSEIPGATRKPSSGVMRVRRTPGRSVCWMYGESQESAKSFGPELTGGTTRSKLAGLPRWGSEDSPDGVRPFLENSTAC